MISFSWRWTCLLESYLTFNMFAELVFPSELKCWLLLSPLSAAAGGLMCPVTHSHPHSIAREIANIFNFFHHDKFLSDCSLVLKWTNRFALLLLQLSWGWGVLSEGEWVRENLWVRGPTAQLLHPGGQNEGNKKWDLVDLQMNCLLAEHLLQTGWGIARLSITTTILSILFTCPQMGGGGACLGKMPI